MRLLLLAVGLVALFGVTYGVLLGGPPDGPPASPARPELGLEEYQSRCFEVTRPEDLRVTNVDYDSRVDVAVARPETFEVALTESVPGLGPPGVPQIKVACTVSAQVVLPDAVDVNPAGWVTQQYVPGDRASFVWTIETGRRGEFEGVVQLKPVIRVEGPDGDVSLEDLTTESFPLTIDSDPTTGQRAGAAWETIVKVAGGVTAVLAAAGALLVLVRRRKKDGAGGGAGTDRPRPSHVSGVRRRKKQTKSQRGRTGAGSSSGR